MPRILSIDYGAKRSGIAVTDPLKIIATALITVDTDKLLSFLEDYCRKEEVEAFVVGQPFRFDGSFSDIETDILSFIARLKGVFPQLPVHRIDESGSSKKSQKALIEAGVKKKQRKDKRLLDSVSATLILQDFLQQR
jgi:putative Holliday junction resolvase